MKQNNMKIVVLAGGTSTERDVSLISGKKIYQSLKENGHKVILLDVFLGYEGEVTEDLFEAPIDWDAKIKGIKETNPDIEEVKKLRPDWKKNFFGPNVIDICKKSDIVFMALHGENGENGKIQATFDLFGIPYTGTDYVSSAICMNKSLSKEIMTQNGIQTPKGIRLKKGEKDPHTVACPCIVKACNGGSSVGVGIARKEEDYEAAKAEAFKYDDEVVIEQFIEGREFSVGVIDGKALPVIEVQPLEGFNDYTNKYQEGRNVDTCPAVLSEEKTVELQKITEKAFKALRLKSYVRFDFMMNANGEFYCLEANTLPGMTPVSLLPQEAKAIGMSFIELCEKLIEIALCDQA